MSVVELRARLEERRVEVEPKHLRHLRLHERQWWEWVHEARYSGEAWREWEQPVLLSHVRVLDLRGEYDVQGVLEVLRQVRLLWRRLRCWWSRM